MLLDKKKLEVMDEMLSKVAIICVERLITSQTRNSTLLCDEA